MLSETFRFGCSSGPEPSNDAKADKFTNIRGNIQFSTNDTEEQCTRQVETFCKMLRSKIATAFHPEREALLTAAINEAGCQLFRTEENEHLF